MNSTLLITGASSGIGKAAALKFSREGWNVIATMRNPENQPELNAPDNILVTRLDVQQPDSITEAIAAGIARFGRIDAVVNNAGYGQFGIFEAITPEQIQQQFDVNVFGVMNVTRAILPHFRQHKSGLFLNISSGAGQFTLPMISLYAASKFALEGFSESLFYELSALNIGVKIIEPGGTETNFNAVTSEQHAKTTDLADYNDFTQAAGKMFAGMVSAQLATADTVAETIYAAATDGTDTLRYVVGNDDFKRRITARKQMPDQEYVNFIRQGFTQFMTEY